MRRPGRQFWRDRPRERSIPRFQRWPENSTRPFRNRRTHMQCRYHKVSALADTRRCRREVPGRTEETIPPAMSILRATFQAPFPKRILADDKWRTRQESRVRGPDRRRAEYNEQKI